MANIGGDMKRGVISDEEKRRAKKAVNDRYLEKHKERLLEKEVCEICGGEYQRWSRGKHEKTKKHQVGIKMLELKKQVDELKSKQ